MEMLMTYMNVSGTRTSSAVSRSIIGRLAQPNFSEIVLKPVSPLQMIVNVNVSVYLCATLVFVHLSDKCNHKWHYSRHHRQQSDVLSLDGNGGLDGVLYTYINNNRSVIITLTPRTSSAYRCQWIEYRHYRCDTANL
jgi:hypothetical protein